MNKMFLIALRKMNPDRIPEIHVKGVKRYSDYRDIKIATLDALRRDCIDLLDVYRAKSTGECYNLEEVIHSVVQTDDISEILYYVSGLKIVYDDRIVNIRFKIDGVDSMLEYTYDPSRRQEFDISLNDGDIHVVFELHRRNAEEEFADYIIQFR